jgi:hypothetical protein
LGVLAAEVEDQDHAALPTAVWAEGTARELAVNHAACSVQ